ncbi:carbohydrate ABC transporter permease [Massilia sp. TS11]|uniref:carbohydrate ABC transporter permease n=1 Tax=Massilia sp. TS11 TaxID=2908003 RepID=UPI001EDA291F|nr:sugar ABC transporter permease [Massilia sp. TS11]MCG2586759.1 sugar ABC transporter permease [Massilia sp. TS11]
MRGLRRLAPHAALLPLAVVTLGAYLGTVLWTLRTSFTSARSFPSDVFVGFLQYQRLFDNERWLVSLDHLALYGVLFIAACLLLGFLLAVLVDQNLRAEGLLRTVFLYPYAMSFVAAGLVWQWMFNPEMGIGLDWLVDETMVIPALVLATTWQSSGLVMAILLAGLRGIDPDLRKAARLDGVPAWRFYLSVALPQLGPAVASAFLILATGVVKLFDPVVAMTGGGPGMASEVPAKFIMDHLFGRANLGLASAGAVMLLVPVLALLLPFALLRRERA